MNDEIKEILEELENMYEISELEEQVNNINKIRNYITNLQQEKNTYKEQLRITHKDLEHYISRCEKAIEYIKNNALYEVLYDDNGNYFNTTDSQATDDLLNILQNGDNNVSDRD